MSNSLELKGAGTPSVNGIYSQVEEKVYEKIETEKSEKFRIQVEKISGYGTVWAVQRTDITQPITFYFFKADQLDQVTAGVAGIDPCPSLTLIDSTSKRTVNEEKINELKQKEKSERAKWTKPNKDNKDKTKVLYWNRLLDQWCECTIDDCQSGYINVSSRQHDFSVWIQQDSDLLLPATFDNQQTPKSWKRGAFVYVWCRQSLQWDLGTVDQIQSDYIFVKFKKSKDSFVELLKIYMSHLSKQHHEKEEEEKKEDPESSYCQSWSYPAWLGTYPLHQDTVLDYFKHSDFYDRTCNNEILAMQINIDANQLQKMKGKEYSVDRTTIKNNPLYLCIHENLRTSVQDVELMKVYYSPGVNGHPHRGHIFPMPVIDMIFMNKLRTAMFHINHAFQSVQDMKSHQLSRGMEWDRNKDTEKDKDKQKVESSHSADIADNQYSSNARKKKKVTISNSNEYASLVDSLIAETISSTNT
ncbi:hypothetical protein RFI_18742 [Reticulomyxa filosa]|uniref:Uncharacterized protein n=1 Tax=Reticulomyxa filosa TaxID=46433 RepID=X6MWZ2_RETFI|nr:hypothetical protein RFI_18742 [Reticulomyxa filosa]|eukprot:ETO18523.1 hypothetical protein RFI_18742 [Reticulomyxa filosa]